MLPYTVRRFGDHKRRRYVHDTVLDVKKPSHRLDVNSSLIECRRLVSNTPHATERPTGTERPAAVKRSASYPPLLEDIGGYALGLVKIFASGVRVAKLFEGQVKQTVLRRRGSAFQQRRRRRHWRNRRPLHLRDIVHSCLLTFAVGCLKLLVSSLASVISSYCFTKQYTGGAVPALYRKMIADYLEPVLRIATWCVSLRE